MTANDTRTIDVDSLEKYFSPSLGELLKKEQPPNRNLPFVPSGVEPFNFDLDSPTSVNLFPPVPVPHSTKGIGPKLKSMLAATLIDFVAFSPRPIQTKGIETAYLIGAIQQRRRASVTVSESLRVPRERAMASSLFAPSGAYLSWLAMDSENGNDK
ncbi:MAG TPA: hypothetical protein VFW05_13650 [Verrucomicrobiae bacterium]|nr:hypothetical protein [Verrucomicrobiae bacterium]